MKLLTISVAAYNVEDYLERTLESLLVKKELRNYLEVIIVNDGSTDRTKEIAERFVSLSPNMFKFIDKSNGGYGSTINASICIAEGLYFKQLDGDDWFIKGNLEKYLLYLKDCTSDIVISPFIKCYENGKRERVDNVPFLKEGCSSTISSLLQNADCLSMHETTIKTKILKANKIKLTEHCFYTDNEYTFFPLLVSSSVAKFGQEIYCYRLGTISQSVSIKGAQKHYRDTMKVALSMYTEVQQVSSSSSFLYGLILCKLKDITDSVYTYYLVGGDKNAKKELMDFDLLLKKDYPDIYKLSNRTKKIYFLRISHFMLFYLLRKKVLAKWA